LEKEIAELRVQRNRNNVKMAIGEHPNIFE
jgi:hypothetical protein